MRSAIGWSHGTLGPAERALFARLAVFPADWSMVAAEHVAGDDIDVLAAMTGLVEKNLVRAARRADGSEGLTMLDSLREFAVEQLDRSGERRELRLRHRDYYAALASEFEARMATVDEGTSVEWLVTEHVNIEAALGCAIETGDISTGLPPPRPSAGSGIAMVGWSTRAMSSRPCWTRPSARGRTARCHRRLPEPRSPQLSSPSTEAT